MKVDADAVQQKYFPTWTVQQKAVTKADPTAKENARNDFNNKVKPQYLKDLANNHDAELRAHGLTDSDIASMRQGKAPTGYNVHHIQALDQGGTNKYDNLVLLKKSPNHDALTGLQNSAMYGLQAKQTRTVPIITPPAGTRVYP